MRFDVQLEGYWCGYVDVSVHDQQAIISVWNVGEQSFDKIIADTERYQQQSMA